MHAVINPCDSSPCSIRGSCIPGMGSPGVDYTCQCVAGYTGPRCEVNINQCQSAICPNNSMCVDGENSYECVCNPDFSMQNGNRCVRIPVTQQETQG
jgi:hypothetical protein